MRWHEAFRHTLDLDNVLHAAYQNQLDRRGKPKNGVVNVRTMQSFCERAYWNARDNLIWDRAEELHERFGARLWPLRQCLAEACFRELPGYYGQAMQSEYGFLFHDDFSESFEEAASIDGQHDEEEEAQIVWCLAHSYATLHWIRAERRGLIPRCEAPSHQQISEWLQQHSYRLVDAEANIAQLGMFGVPTTTATEATTP